MSVLDLSGSTGGDFLVFVSCESWESLDFDSALSPNDFCLSGRTEDAATLGFISAWTLSLLTTFFWISVAISTLFWISVPPSLPFCLCFCLRTAHSFCHGARLTSAMSSSPSGVVGAEEVVIISSSVTSPVSPRSPSNSLSLEGSLLPRLPTITGRSPRGGALPGCC